MNLVLFLAFIVVLGSCFQLRDQPRLAAARGDYGYGYGSSENAQTPAMSPPPQPTPALPPPPPAESSGLPPPPAAESSGVPPPPAESSGVPPAESSGVPPPSNPEDSTPFEADCMEYVCLSVPCNHPSAQRFGRPIAYTIFGYSGGVYITGESGVADGTGTSEDDATKLYVVPVHPESVTSRALQYKVQEFYLQTATGLYLERYARISAETNTDLPHQSARFNLAFVSTPTQTWTVDYDGTGNVPNNNHVGIVIGGTGTDWTLPNNNIRRTLTLRAGDGISVVVQWFESDENIAFKPSSFVSTAPTCSSASPFAFSTDCSSDDVCLSLPCTNPNSQLFGNPVAYTIFGYSGSVFIAGDTGVAGITSDENQASKFYVVPAQPELAYSRTLQYKTQEFYLVSPSGLYLERFARISSETPSDLPHQSARFNLAWASTPSQTWRVDYGSDGDVPNSKNVGITIAGTGTDWSLPDNSIRRTLTLRSGDGISVVVQWWESDEQIAFRPSSFFTVQSSCSAAAPFALQPLSGGQGVQLSVPCNHPLAQLFGVPVAYRLFGYSGSVYLSQSSTTLAGFTSDANSAAILFAVPAMPGSVTTRNLQYGQDFYLVNRNGQYLQRYQRISTETPTDLPHQSARFNLGFFATPSQTWRVDYTGSGSVPESSNIGISIAGANTDWTQPDNNIRRVLTLRSSDGISVVVQWWQSDEQVALQRLPANPGTCSVAEPFALGPLPGGQGVQLSLPCDDPLAQRFGLAVSYRLFGYSGSVYLSQSSTTLAGVNSNVNSALELFVIPAFPGLATTRNLQYGQDFYLINRNRQYLQRYQRISTETPSDLPHQSARFNLGFAATPSQTWRVDYTGRGVVPESANIGLTIAGSNTDWTQPDNNIRRTLTLRSSDGISVVVQWWKGDEQVALQRLPALIPGPCSASSPFPRAPLPPANVGNFIQLSLPCGDPLQPVFGTPQTYNLFGYSGNGAYVSAKPGGPAGVSALVGNATKFLVVPANPSAATSRLLQGGQEFYLLTTDGYYLQRYQRIGTETTSSQPFLSARFNTGLASKPTQTWKVDYGSTTGGVANTARIGLSVAGTSGDWTSPDNNIRRLLTIRIGDATTVLVQAWNGDENVGLKVASPLTC